MSLHLWKPQNHQPNLMDHQHTKPASRSIRWSLEDLHLLLTALQRSILHSMLRLHMGYGRQLQLQMKEVMLALMHGLVDDHTMLTEMLGIFSMFLKWCLLPLNYVHGLNTGFSTKDTYKAFPIPPRLPVEPPVPRQTAPFDGRLLCTEFYEYSATHVAKLVPGLHFNKFIQAQQQTKSFSNHMKFVRDNLLRNLASVLLQQNLRVPQRHMTSM